MCRGRINKVIKNTTCCIMQLNRTQRKPEQEYLLTYAEYWCWLITDNYIYIYFFFIYVKMWSIMLHNYILSEVFFPHLNLSVHKFLHENLWSLPFVVDVQSFMSVHIHLLSTRLYFYLFSINFFSFWDVFYDQFFVSGFSAFIVYCCHYV